MKKNVTRLVGKVQWFRKQRMTFVNRVLPPTFTIYDHLLPHATQVKVAHPLMLRAIAAAKKKNDRIDAGKIADCLRCDFLPECHMASTASRDRRRTLRYRHLLVRQMVQMKNRISGLLMETGVSHNKLQLHKVGYFRELLASNEEVNESIRPPLRVSRDTIVRLQKIEYALVSSLQRDPLLAERIKRLRTVPGVGPITALTWAWKWVRSPVSPRFGKPSVIAGSAAMRRRHSRCGDLDHGRTPASGIKKVLRGGNLMSHNNAFGIQGHVSRGFESVREVFTENFDGRGELGGACCAFIGGKKVVDLWGGIRNKRTREPWEQDTLVVVHSAAKGLAAMTLAIAHSRGWLDYEERVCAYWPDADFTTNA